MPQEPTNPKSIADSLTALAERCEAASGPDRELDACIAVAASGDPAALVVTPSTLSMFSHKPGWWCDGADKSHVAPEYTASLDAAMTLIPEEWAIDCLKEGEAGSWYVNMRPRNWVSEWQFGKAATPALALTAAALRAHILKESQS